MMLLEELVRHVRLFKWLLMWLVARKMALRSAMLAHYRVLVYWLQRSVVSTEVLVDPYLALIVFRLVLVVIRHIIWEPTSKLLHLLAILISIEVRASKWLWLQILIHYLADWSLQVLVDWVLPCALTAWTDLFLFTFVVLSITIQLRLSNCLDFLELEILVVIVWLFSLVTVESLKLVINFNQESIHLTACKIVLLLVLWAYTDI